MKDYIIKENRVRQKDNTGINGSCEKSCCSCCICQPYPCCPCPECRCASDYAVFIESGETWRGTFPIGLMETDDSSPHIRLKDGKDLILAEGGYLVTFHAQARLPSPGICRIFAVINDTITNYSAISQPLNTSAPIFSTTFYVRGGEGTCLNLVYQHIENTLDANIQVVIQKLRK